MTSSFLSYLARDDSTFIEDETVINSCILGELKEELGDSTSTNESSDASRDSSSFISPLEFSVTIDGERKVANGELRPKSTEEIDIEAVWIRKEEQSRVCEVMADSLKKGGHFTLNALIPTRKYSVLSRDAIISGWGAPDSSVKTMTSCKVHLKKAGLRVDHLEQKKRATSKRVWSVVFEEMRKDMKSWGDIVKKCELRQERGEKFLGYLASKIDISVVEVQGCKP